MQDYASNLSQAERLAALPVSPFVTIRDEESEIVSSPPNGFRMPSMSRVREHDARLMLHGSSVNVREDVDEEEESDNEAELYTFAVDKRRESMREHSFRLPSQRSRADVRDALRFMGCGFGE